jgi:hypothetical protein
VRAERERPFMPVGMPVGTPGGKTLEIEDWTVIRGGGVS